MWLQSFYSFELKDAVYGEKLIIPSYVKKDS